MAKFSMSGGVFSLLCSAAGDAKGECNQEYGFLLEGDLCQMSTQEDFLRAHGFDVARRNRDVVYSSKHNGDASKISYCPTWLTATTERWACTAGEQGHRPELYDLRAAPGQKRTVARRHPDVAGKLQAGVVEFLRGQDATDGYVARYE